MWTELKQGFKEGIRNAFKEFFYPITWAWKKLRRSK